MRCGKSSATVTILGVFVLAASCGGSTPSGSTPTDAGASDTSGSTDAATDTPTPPDQFGGDRPVPVFRVPSGYDPKKPAPLVLVLHGYGAGGVLQNAYFGLGAIADEMGFFLVAPDGTVDSKKSRFWNAVDTCCDFDGKKPDDVKYLTGLVTEISTYYAIDPKRVYLLGHSNGGAMAMRLGCDVPETFAAVVDLAGPFWSDPKRCAPKAPIAFRHMHGTVDETVPYAGGAITVGGLVTPSARTIAETFAAADGCGAPSDGPAVDLERSLAGAETKVVRWSGCKGGAEVELYSIEGAGHIPKDFDPSALPRSIWAFFAAHPRP